MSAQSELITSSITYERSFHIPQEYTAAWVEILSLSYWLLWQVRVKVCPTITPVLSSSSAGELRCVQIFIYEQFCTSAALKCLTVLVFWIWLHIWSTHSSSTKSLRPNTSILLTSSPCYCCREVLQKKTPPVSSNCWIIHWSDSLPNRKLSGNHYKLNECMFSEAGYELLRFWQCFKARKGCCKLTEWNQSTPLPTV